MAAEDHGPRSKRDCSEDQRLTRPIRELDPWQVVSSVVIAGMWLKKGSSLLLAPGHQLCWSFSATMAWWLFLLRRVLVRSGFRYLVREWMCD